jgi:catechol 2,3-dioxygenase-like lactoylglutathione lyase family enzyme
MIDHVTLRVSDLARSRAFHEAALRPLGIAHLYAEGTAFAGHGVGGKAFFWIGAKAGPITGARIAPLAADRATVDRFHAAALAAGGRDNGAPGARRHSHADHHGAFALDPDGHTIEAVCHRAEA